MVVGHAATLTEEQKRDIIEMIIHGCTRLISTISEDNPLKYARARSHHQTKSLTSTFIYLNFHKMITRDSKIRLSNVRKRLPEKLQNIQDGDLSRISTSCVRTGMISKSQDGKSRPGHPAEHEDSNIGIPGTKSFLEHSSFQKILEKALADPETRKKIYNRLLYSGLLYTHLVAQGMKASYIAKEDDKEAAWNIVDSSRPPNMRSHSDFEDIYNAQNQELSSLNKKQIEKKAESWAKHFINSHNADDYISLYRVGALYYFCRF